MAQVLLALFGALRTPKAAACLHLPYADFGLGSMPRYKDRRMLKVVISTLLPLFLMVLAGWFAQRKSLLPKNSSKTLNDFVFFFTLPALLFSSLATTPIEEIFQIRFATAYTMSMIISYLCMFGISSWLFKACGPVSCIRSASASLPNSAFLGLPIIISLFDNTHETLVIVTLSILLPTAIVMLIVTQFEMYQNAGRQGRGAVLRNVGVSLLKTPGIMMAFAGIAVSLSGLQIPTFLTDSMQSFGMASVPCTLFAIGMLIAQLDPKLNLKSVLSVNLMKLIIQPALAAALLYAFGITGKTLVIGALLAGMPSAPLACVFSQVYNAGESETSATVFISMLVYIPVFWGIITIANGFGVAFG